jgi:hypothetical protein
MAILVIAQELNLTFRWFKILPMVSNPQTPKVSSMKIGVHML